MNNTLDTIYVKPSPQRFAYFIDEDITEPSSYRELAQVLISMQEGDELELQINCFGGFLHTTTMLSSLIRNTKGHVHGVLNGVAMSGASILLLSCHSVEVMPHSTLMAHTSNGQNFGKLSDSIRSVNSSAKQLEALYRDVYFGFFTESEITDILEGKDFYIEYDEICERLEKREKAIQEEAANFEEAFQRELSSMMDADKEPEWVLNKLTKQQLVKYVQGEIGIEWDEESKTVTIITDESVDSDNK